MNNSFQALLDRQVKYGVELVGDNKDFYEWSVSDYEKSWKFNEGSPKTLAFDKNMIS